MELRHRMTQKHLQQMSNRLEIAGGEKEMKQIGQEEQNTSEEDREEDTFERYTKSNRGSEASGKDCAECGSVFSSDKILRLHRCGSTSGPKR